MKNKGNPGGNILRVLSRMLLRQKILRDLSGHRSSCPRLKRNKEVRICEDRTEHLYRRQKDPRDQTP